MIVVAHRQIHDPHPTLADYACYPIRPNAVMMRRYSGSRLVYSRSNEVGILARSGEQRFDLGPQFRIIPAALVEIGATFTRRKIQCCLEFSVDLPEAFRSHFWRLYPIQTVTDDMRPVSCMALAIQRCGAAATTAEPVP